MNHHPIAMVFDIETTGFPKKWNVHPFNVSNYDTCRVINLGYVLLDKNNNVIKKVDHLIKHPESIIIPNSDIHGITNQDIEDNGIPFNDVLTEFIVDIYSCKKLVAHNIDFDFNVLLSELYRNYEKCRKIIGQMYTKELVCTMKIGQQFMNITKYPKLTELYKRLYNEEWNQTHRALDDATVCAKCYVHLTKKMI
jgi:DNA polymerase-3 subunit alpha